MDFLKAGVALSSILAPNIFNMFTSNVPRYENTTLATFTDNTSIISTNVYLTRAFDAPQTHLREL